MKTINKDLFIKICNEELTMAKAAAKLNLHFNTFKKYALKFGCYSPNQSGKGIKKNIKKRIINLEEYSTRASIRRVIIKENLIQYKCSECNIQNWNNKSLSLHLDHINGMSNDNRLENLRFLCPNCHSQTETYTGRNKK
jgi:5-methylcytosine-specific restriction endonuclease McrA